MAGSFHCSTSNVAFETEEELRTHYKSAWHRYNLKRKVAGLPPVTREWFETRQAATRALNTPEEERVWICTVTKKKFSSEATYQTHTRTKKYLAVLKKKGFAEPPEPLVRTRSSANEEGSGREVEASRQEAAAESVMEEDEIEEEEEGDEDGWETASDEEAEEYARKVEEDRWDPKRCFFSNKVSQSMADNLEQMYKHYGFYIPDLQFLVDAPGLMEYLGAKLTEGGIPFYISGLKEDAKRFSSLHAVQRHMIDVGKCKILYEGNEEEYEDYYDYSAAEEEVANMLAVSSSIDVANNGAELVIRGENGKQRYLGAREFARYYKQKHRPTDTRASVTVGLLSRYNLLGLDTKPEAQVLKERAEKAAKRGKDFENRILLRTQLRRNKNDNLPQWCPF